MVILFWIYLTAGGLQVVMAFNYRFFPGLKEVSLFIFYLFFSFVLGALIPQALFVAKMCSRNSTYSVVCVLLDEVLKASRVSSMEDDFG